MASHPDQGVLTFTSVPTQSIPNCGSRICLHFPYLPISEMGVLLKMFPIGQQSG
jgi:hypothetical protein